MTNMVLEIRMGDVVRLRKPHPCGSYEWQVVRLGADIGMVCTVCGRRVLLPRREFEKRVKSFIRRGGPTSDDPADPGESPLGITPRGSRQTTDYRQEKSDRGHQPAD